MSLPSEFTFLGIELSYRFEPPCTKWVQVCIFSSQDWRVDKTSFLNYVS